MQKSINSTLWLFLIFCCNNAVPLRENHPNTEFFLSVFSLIRTEYEDLPPYLSVFNPNEGKYGPEKTPYLNAFHAVYGILNGDDNGLEYFRFVDF